MDRHSRVALVMLSVVLGACAGTSRSPASTVPTATPSLTAPPTATLVPTATPSLTAPPTATPVPTATTPPAAASPSVAAPASPAAGTTTFTSPVYGYSITIPAGWKTIAASTAWDGKTVGYHDAPESDQFIGPPPASAWAAAFPSTKDLAGWTADEIAANSAGHSSTCPPVPEVNEPVDVGGGPGTLLGYNCGILINIVVAVHGGVAYLFGFRDPRVHAASDPTDKTVLAALVGSVVFP